MREIQERLSAVGLEAGPADGLIGTQTRAAIREFEQRNGLAPSGEATAEIWRLLGEAASKSPHPAVPLAAPARPRQAASRPAEARSKGGEFTLAGTSWRFHDDTGGAFDLTFEPDGKVTGPAYSSGWTWTQEQEDIELRYDNRIGGSSVRTGRLLTDREMSGTGSSSRGTDWNWEASRIR